MFARTHPPRNGLADRTGADDDNDIGHEKFLSRTNAWLASAKRVGLVSAHAFEARALLVPVDVVRMIGRVYALIWHVVMLGVHEYS
jgi:hypothetical protein